MASKKYIATTALLTFLICQQSKSESKNESSINSLKGISKFRFDEDNKDQLKLYLGNTNVATYLIRDPKLTRRALVNLRTATGIPVTRPFPAEEKEDHAIMHPGLWISYGWISGNDYWRLKSKVIFDGFIGNPIAKEHKAKFSTRNRYLNEKGNEPICFEDTSYAFSIIPEGILIDIVAVYYNNEREFAFGDQEESGLALRMAKPLTVKFGNGRILNDTGDLNGKGTWGKPFKWIDYSGIHDGKRIGLLLIPSNKNKRESWAHSRDYGVLVANPFPKQPQERREPYVKTLIKKGEKLKMQYRVLIHENQKGQLDPKKIADHLLNQ